ncbi:MAG: carotenoid oxygenase family protein [Hyphomonadaceae bacterium]|nr:carotenoid oxygenase family protein [Hyphomonadaceae bacterium]
MLKFPDSPSFTGFNQPARFEADIADVETEGDIPEDLDGAFYRVQPDPQYPPLLGEDIAFNGDGAVSMFRFKGGRVHFKHRWVQTDKFKLERAAGKALFGAYRNPLTDDPAVKGKIRGTANTNAFPFAGKLFALKEDSPPVVMDLNTLESKGYTDFGGKMKSQTFTAHPKIDPETGEMVAFGYAAKGLLTKDMAYYTLNAKGEVTRETWFELPYYCMMHDFGVTRDYAVFHVVPSIGSWERLEAGLPHFGFDTTKEVYLGILPRDGEGRDVRWFKTGNCFASHVMNAHNVGTKIHFDTPQAKNNMFPFFPDVHGAPFNMQEAHSRLTRWTVDMNSNSDSFESQTTLCDLFGEFPRIDDRYATQSYRHGYMLVMDMSKPFEAPGGRSGAGLIMNTLAHYDHATGRTQSWWCGPTSTLQEPCFVPKRANAAEGEGYIVQVCNRLDERVSDLLVFDAERIAEGPIGAAKLGVRLRFGLHGNWAPGAMLN